MGDAISMSLTEAEALAQALHNLMRKVGQA